MELTLLKGKLHQATVTATELDYEGSVAISEDLLEAANILPYEQVDIYNITSGERFTTYAILGPRGTGTISIQGAAAHKATVGDKVIIAAYARMSEAEAKKHTPSAIMMDENNQPKVTGSAPVQTVSLREPSASEATPHCEGKQAAAGGN